MKLLGGALFFVLLLSLTSSCEQMFTYSPLTWAQRDPANLPEAQQVAYAENLLGSGASKEELAAAYEAIADSSDPEVQYLASQVAFAASGVNEAVEDVLGDFENITTAEIETILDGLDDTMLENAVTSMDEAEADSSTKTTIASQDYLITAAAILLSDPAVVDVTDPTIYEPGGSLDSATPNKSGGVYDKTLYYLQESGYTADDLDQLMNFGG